MTIAGTQTIGRSQCEKEANERSIDVMQVIFEYNAKRITVIMYK